VQQRWAGYGSSSASDPGSSQRSGTVGYSEIPIDHQSSLIINGIEAANNHQLIANKFNNYFQLLLKN